MIALRHRLSLGLGQPFDGKDRLRRRQHAGDDDPGRPGDLPSVERAAGELRRAGFADVTARAGDLVHPFTIEGYVGFMAEFHEESLIAGLDPELRTRFLGTLRDRLAALTPAQMTMRFPIVFAAGRRSR